MQKHILVCMPRFLDELPNQVLPSLTGYKSSLDVVD